MMISVHLPKTAGSTFKHVLHHTFGWRVFFDYGDQYAFTDPEPPTPQARLLRLRRNAKYRPVLLPSDCCIHGHFKATKYDRSFPNATKVTWLRDPVERVVSHYNHWKRNPDPSHSVCRALHREGWSLLKFAQQEPMMNVQARYLDGVALDVFTFVGVQEHFNELLPRFLDHIGLKRVTLEARNVNSEKGVRQRYPLERAVWSEINALNADDRVLYDRACSLLGLESLAVS